MSELSVEHLEKKPDFVALHRLSPERYPFVLESAAHGTPIGRYDILFAFPQDEINLFADESGLNHQADFLSELDASLPEVPPVHDAPINALPFRGGWFLFLSYELAQQIEPTLALPLSTDMPNTLCNSNQVAMWRC